MMSLPVPSSIWTWIFRTSSACSISFILICFDIDYRRNLTVDAGVIKDGKATDSETCQLINKRRVLRRRIDDWRDIRDTYMPSVTKYWAQSGSSDDSFEHPEAIPLL